MQALCATAPSITTIPRYRACQAVDKADRLWHRATDTPWTFYTLVDFGQKLSHKASIATIPIVLKAK